MRKRSLDCAIIALDTFIDIWLELLFFLLYQNLKKKTTF